MIFPDPNSARSFGSGSTTLPRVRLITPDPEPAQDPDPASDPTPENRPNKENDFNRATSRFS